jgi:hypothetical protein
MMKQGHCKGGNTMEAFGLFLLVLIELTAGILSYLYWLRNRSELPLAKAESIRSILDHYQKGTHEQYVSEIANGKAPGFKKRRQLPILLWSGISMILGVGVLFALVRVINPQFVIRAIVGTVAILPFMWFTAIAIAEETDKNNISRFENTNRAQLLNWMKDGTLESQIKSMT